MIVVDTNVLIYSANKTSPFHVPCNQWLQGRYATAPEARYVTAWAFVSKLLESPSVGVLSQTERHPDVFQRILADFPRLAGNVFHDVHTVALMREHGIRQICTCDSVFHRFKFLDVVDPLKP